MVYFSVFFSDLDQNRSFKLKKLLNVCLGDSLYYFHFHIEEI